MQLSTQFDFEVINNIKSEGVNSSLYMVKDLQVGSKFILKQIDKKGLKEPERYFEESKKIYKLKHPNIMEIHSASYDNEYIYITMPYLKNGSLQHLIENQNLTLRQIIKYSLDFLSAIYYVHEKYTQLDEKRAIAKEVYDIRGAYEGLTYTAKKIVTQEYLDILKKAELKILNSVGDLL